MVDRLFPLRVLLPRRGEKLQKAEPLLAFRAHLVDGLRRRDDVAQKLEFSDLDPATVFQPEVGRIVGAEIDPAGIAESQRAGTEDAIFRIGMFACEEVLQLHRPVELEHFLAGKHTYAEYRIFGSRTLTLCNTCWIDFGSYNPSYFGLKDGRRIQVGELEFLRDIIPPPETIDKVCPECEKRLGFLEFLASAREQHA